jgi:hypothetical protein
VILDRSAHQAECPSVLTFTGFGAQTCDFAKTLIPAAGSGSSGARDLDLL